MWLNFQPSQNSLQFYLALLSVLRISIIQQSYWLAIASTELCELVNGVKADFIVYSVYFFVILQLRDIWQDVIWIEKKGAEIQLLTKSMNMWFLCFWGFIMAVGNQIMQKILQNLLSGYFLA